MAGITTTRKQREIREREQAILETARPMLLRSGYHGLSMDRIAEALQYSKGTIYNHFPCKEEVILALGIQTLEKRTELFGRAAAFAGLPRERMCAIGVAVELFVRLYPDHFHVERLIRAGSIWEKTSQHRQMTLRACETRCMGMVSGIVRDGVAEGHLRLPEQSSPEDLVFGLWSLSLGAYSIIASSDSLVQLGIRSPAEAVRQNQILLIDGYGWRPLSPERNYDEVCRRIRRDIFLPECQALGEAP
jgi:AcrR family transcriptional regulator